MPQKGSISSCPTRFCCCPPRQLQSASLCYPQTRLYLAFKAAGGSRLGQTLLFSRASEEMPQGCPQGTQGSIVTEPCMNPRGSGRHHESCPLEELFPAASTKTTLTVAPVVLAALLAGCPNRPSPPCPTPHVAGGLRGGGLCYSRAIQRARKRSCGNRPQPTTPG